MKRLNSNVSETSKAITKHNIRNIFMNIMSSQTKDRVSSIKSSDSDDQGIVPGSPLKLKPRFQSFIDKLEISQDFVTGNLEKMPNTDIVTAINMSLEKELNPVNRMSQFWQEYLQKKYRNIPPFMKTLVQIKTDLRQDIEFIKKFMLKVVVNIYRDWIEYHPIEQFDIRFRILPNLITKGPSWKQFLNILLTHFGMLRLTFDRDKLVNDPSYFGVKQFKHHKLTQNLTLKVLQDYVSLSNIKYKYDMASDINQVLHCEMETNYNVYLSTNPQMKPKQITYDHKVHFMEFTILQLNHNIGIHLFLQQLFYSHQNMHILYDSQIVEYMEVAYDRLTKRNKNGMEIIKWQQSELSEQPMLSISLDMGTAFKSSSITFDTNSPFAHCFTFDSYKKIKANNSTLISMLSLRPLKDGCYFKISLEGDNVFLGIYRKPNKPERNRNFVNLQNSVTICIKNGRIFKNGKSEQLKNHEKVKGAKEVYMGLDGNTLVWQLSQFGQNVAEEDISQLLKDKSSVYLHVCLSNKASVEVH